MSKLMGNNVSSIYSRLLRDEVSGYWIKHFSHLTGLMAVTLLCANLAHAETMHVKQWAGGMTTAAKQYNKELISNIMKLTEEKYGPYKITYDYRDMNARRTQSELVSGAKINLNISPGIKRNSAATKGLIVSDIPAFHGLLGFRRCIVRAGDIKLFKSGIDHKDFNKLTVGQPKFWNDVAVYKNADLPMSLPGSYDQLFPMLRKERFDYLPLGALEVVQSLKEQTDYPDLAIAPNFFIYYPIPVYAVVSGREKRLAERIQEGLQTYFDSEAAWTLFDKHFGTELKGLDVTRENVFVLTNPSFNMEENKKITELFYRWLETKSKE